MCALGWKDGSGLGLISLISNELALALDKSSF